MGVRGAREVIQKTAPMQQSMTLEQAILMTKGPFCTPRSVMKVYQKKNSADDVMLSMKELEKKDVGKFMELKKNEKAFYKPLPHAEKKDIVCSILGGDPEKSWEQYGTNFKMADSSITDSQHDRLLFNSPYYDKMEEYGMEAM